MSFPRLARKTISNFRMVLLLASSISATAQAPVDIGELFASEPTAQGPVLLAGTGMAVASGSQVAAGKSVATLRLARGGEIRLCPSASLTVSGVQNNLPPGSQELMLSMDPGSVELDYPLNDMADTLITPDFKIMLAGPGVFHFGFAVNNRGDTCIKPLRGNSASLIVTEMLGNGVYQVKPDEAVMFAGGKLSGRSPMEIVCGCPKPPPVMEAKEQEEPKEAPPVASDQPKPTSPSSTTVVASDVTAPLPAEKPNATHMQVEVPMIYRADQPEPAYAVARIRFSALPNVFWAQEKQKPIVLKPGKEEVSAKNKEKKGFLGKVKGFFAALFR
jgi:hypothetical protein